MNDPNLKLYWYEDPIEDNIPITIPEVIEVQTEEIIEENITNVTIKIPTEEDNEVLIENQTEENITILITGQVISQEEDLDSVVKKYLSPSVKVNRARKQVEFIPYDFDNDGYVDYIEWIVPHLSAQIYEIIYITQAEHLGVNKEFITNIYNEVFSQDNIWTNPIHENEYIRVRFEKQLDNTKDITIHAKSEGISDIIVYIEDETTEIARFRNVEQEATHKIYLTSLVGNEDTFDLKIIGNSVEFDYIVDPTPITDAVPQTFNIHGKLSNSSGSMNGTFQFTFNIYDSYTGGVSLWNSVRDVTITDGIFYDVILDATGLNFSEQYYLGITIEGDSEMAPRMNLTTSPYSFMAQNVYVGGIIFDENLNATGYNITADYFIGNGSLLTGISGADNQSWNQSLAETLFYSIFNPLNYWNDTYATFNKTYADTLYADIAVAGDNESWNESYADTLYADISVTSLWENSSGNITTSSRVGIGTTTPSETLKLDVEGQVGATEYCDENGINCKDISTVGTGSGDLTEVTGGNAITVTFGTGPIPDIAVTANSIGNNEIVQDSIGTTEIATGGVATAEILDNTIQEIDLEATNTPTDNYILSYDSATAGFTWIVDAIGGAGDVASVGLSMPSIFNVANSPVTTSGTLTATLVSQAANLVFASPSGSAGSPNFRSLVANDIPNLAVTKLTTGTLAIARGGTGLSASIEDAIMIGNGVNNWEAKIIPDCTTGKLLYTAGTNEFSCGTDANDGGDILGVTAGTGLTGGGTTGTPTLNVASHAGTAGSVGTVNLGADTVGVNLGTTSTTAYRGDYGNIAYNHVTTDVIETATDVQGVGVGGDVTGTIGNIAIGANSVALGTDTTGNYAGSSSEGGSALTGDSATSFFPSGNIESIRMPTGGAWTLTSNLNFDSNTLVIDQTNNRVGIGTTTPSAKLDVEVSSGGAATIGSSLNSATGDYAVAMGGDTTASGPSATAMGYRTNASGFYSTAMGFWTTALGSTSTAMGAYTTASGTSSVAMGSNTDAIGSYSTAMGRTTNASGDYSTAMGAYTIASGDYSTAMGREIQAGADYVVAIGLDDMNGVNCNQANSMCIMGGDVGIGVTDPHSKLEVNGAISSSVKVISASSDALDVSGVNSVIVSPSDANIYIAGLANGVDGQIVHIYKSHPSYTMIIEHNEASGTQKIICPDGVDLSFTKYGGVTLACNGISWYVIG